MFDYTFLHLFSVRTYIFLHFTDSSDTPRAPTLHLFLDPCHQYGNDIVLFRLGQGSACRYVMPLGKTAAATAAGCMLGQENATICDQ